MRDTNQSRIAKLARDAAKKDQRLINREGPPTVQPPSVGDGGYYLTASDRHEK